MARSEVDKMLNNFSSNDHIAKIKLLFDIFTTFFKISPITFGGGFAMIPILEREIVEKKKWINDNQIADIFSVSQSVPGAVAVNSAIYIGYRLAGIPGALVAMIGIVLPTFFTSIILVTVLASFQSNPYIQAALKGVNSVIVVLIAFAGYKMGKVSLVDRMSWTLLIITIILLLLFKNLNLFFLIPAGAFAGITIIKIRKKVIGAVKSKRDIKQKGEDS